MVSKKFTELMGLTQAIEPVRSERKPAEPRTAPGKMINAITGRDEALDRAERAEAELEALKASLLIPLDRLVEVEGRKRGLSDDEFNELKANIRQHGLITPITVRQGESQIYEIVSGHNRVMAFRELAKEDADKFGKIKAYVDNASDAQKATELAFYANLLHPDLPDVEKYRGLKKIQEIHTHLTTARALAEHVGMGEVQVGRLLKIGELPANAQALLDAYPRAFGAAALGQLANIAARGRANEVLQAMQAVVDRKIDQATAVEQAKGNVETVELAKEGGSKPKAKPAAKSVPHTFKSGKVKYGSLRTVKNVIRIELIDEQETLEVEKLLKALLEERAAARKQ